MVSDYYSWVTLKNICPINIEDIIKHADEIERMINVNVTSDKIDEARTKLIMASCEMEIMITKLVSLLYNVDLIKTQTDQAVYSFLKEDLSRYMAIIDDKQNKLIEIHDNDETAGIGRTSAFKKVLYTALYGIFYNTLYFSSLEYSNFHPEGRNKEKNDFIRILFLVLAINLSTLGGLTRLKGTSVGRGTQGENQVGFTHKSIFPSTTKSLYGKGGEDMIKDEYKYRYGEEFPEIADPFQDNIGDEYEN